MAAGSLHLHLFGRAQFRLDNRPLSLDAGKVTELFAYLLLFRDRAHFRETLADVMWNEHSSSQSRRYLRQALWQLQTVFTHSGQREFTDLIQTDTDWIRVQLCELIWLDVAEFEKAFNATRGISGRELTGDQAHTLQRTVDLYRGDLLEGYYQDWAVFERERLQTNYLSILEKLMDYYEATRAYENGLDNGTRILRLDAAHERTHRRLMRLYYLAGDRTSALRQYEKCSVALHRELGVKPAEETRLLFQQLADHSPLAADASTTSQSASFQPTTDQKVSWETIVHDIEYMRRALSALQRHLQTLGFMGEPIE